MFQILSADYVRFLVGCDICEIDYQVTRAHVWNVRFLGRKDRCFVSISCELGTFRVLQVRSQKSAMADPDIDGASARCNRAVIRRLSCFVLLDVNLGIHAVMMPILLF